MRYTACSDLSTPLDLFTCTNTVSGDMFGIGLFMIIGFIIIGYMGIRHGRSGLLSSFTIMIFLAIIMRAAELISPAIVNLVLVILVGLFFVVGIYKPTRF